MVKTTTASVRKALTTTLTKPQMHVTSVTHGVVFVSVQTMTSVRTVRANSSYLEIPVLIPVQPAIFRTPLSTASKNAKV